MRTSYGLGLLLLSLVVSALGCGAEKPNLSTGQDPEAKIKANLVKLDPKDRELAEQQKYCAVESENRLGKMGKPIKVEVKGQPVFLCCKSCTDKAQEDPDKTLADVKKLKAKAAAEK
jgi:hypothetical protein